MRKVSILSLGIAAAVALLGSPAYSATLVGNDLPDVRLGLGGSADNVIDLNQFFDADSDISFSVSGEGSQADGMLSVMGGAAPGVNQVEVTASADGETLTDTVNVYINGFSALGGPGVDDNNRVAGQLGGNVFFNGIVPGQSVNSAAALELPDLGGGVSPGGVTGAALIATIADVSLDYSDSGLAMRNVNVVASGDGTVSNGGLTATINSDGSYTLETSDAFSGDWIVTLGAEVAGNRDAVHVLAAAATELNLSDGANHLVQPAGVNPAGSVAFGADGAVYTAAAGQGNLVIYDWQTTVDTGDRETVTINAVVNSNSSSVWIAVVAFDGAVGGELSYTNVTGAHVATGADQNIAVTVTPQNGGVVPAVQVFNAGSTDASVTLKSLEVVEAGSPVEYALNPNAEADLPVDGSVPSADGWASDLLQQGAAAPTFNGQENNFAGQGSGSLQLDSSTSDLAQAFLSGVAVGEGTVVAESYVKRVGDAPAGSALALVFLDGASVDMGAFPGGASLSADTWSQIQTSATLAQEVSGFLVLQTAAGLNLLVDDVSLRVVDDNEAWFDASLLDM